MAAKKTSPAMDFIVSYLKKNKKAAYADVRDAADKKGMQIYPIMYGRAQALLNIVPMSPRGSKKKKASKKSTGRPVGRPRKATTQTRRSSSTSSVSGVDSIVDHVRSLEQERDTYRDALERLRDVLDTALSK
jgi:hypothetical protein